MRVIHLNRKNVLANINRLIEIDKVLDLDPWAIDNFLIDLDGKWEYSLVALENDQIVGFLICSVKENVTLHIHKIAVVPEYQREKIGSALLKYLFNKGHENHMKKITLKVKKSNVNAQGFYEELNFKKITTNGCRYIYARVL